MAHDIEALEEDNQRLREQNRRQQGEIEELRAALAEVTEHCIAADHDPTVFLNLQRHG